MIFEQNEEWIRHATELRNRLIIVIGFFFLIFCCGLMMSPWILTWLKAYPATAEIQWNVFSFTDGLFIYIRCAFLISLLFTLPLMLYQTWAFIRPGLTEAEAKGIFAYVPTSFLLFLTGMSFSYFLVFPMMLRFMSNLNKSIGAVETYGIGRYFSFLFNTVFPIGLAFEMPLIMLFLTRLGLLSPERIKLTRKYAYVGLAIFGGCISPPDFVSHLSVTIPLLMLFELSAFASARYYKKRSAISTKMT